mgnify:CR=1 FL=1
MHPEGHGAQRQRSGPPQSPPHSAADAGRGPPLPIGTHVTVLNQLHNPINGLQGVVIGRAHNEHWHVCLTNGSMAILRASSLQYTRTHGDVSEPEVGQPTASAVHGPQTGAQAPPSGPQGTDANDHDPPPPTVLVCKTHLGTRNGVFRMKRYVFRRTVAEARGPLAPKADQDWTALRSGPLGPAQQQFTAPLGSAQRDPTEEAPPKDPDAFQTIPGMHLLAGADLVVVFTRFMKLPDDELRHLNTYLDSGRPVIGIRTANHGFSGRFPYKVNGKNVRFGDDVLGGAFRGHHGGWHRESTRGIVVDENQGHVILRGVTDVWGPSDVYRTYGKDKSLPERCTALLLGQPLTGLNHDDPPNEKKIPLPIAWTTTFPSESTPAPSPAFMSLPSPLLP